MNPFPPSTPTGTTPTAPNLPPTPSAATTASARPTPSHPLLLLPPCPPPPPHSSRDAPHHSGRDAPHHRASTALRSQPTLLDPVTPATDPWIPSRIRALLVYRPAPSSVSRIQNDTHQAPPRTPPDHGSTGWLVSSITQHHASPPPVPKRPPASRRHAPNDDEICVFCVLLKRKKSANAIHCSLLLRFILLFFLQKKIGDAIHRSPTTANLVHGRDPTPFGVLHVNIVMPA
ncbi:hypothetical protein VPH35_072928 [Triticum aestivum]